MGHPALARRAGTSATCEVKDQSEDTGSREGGAATKAGVCVYKTKGQLSPPPHPIEIHGWLERQVSKSRRRAPSPPGSSLCAAQRRRGFGFRCIRVCFGAQGDPPGPRASSGRERGAGPPRGWVPLVAGPNLPRPDNAEGGLGEAFVSLFYTLSFQGGEEGAGLKKFLNFNQVWL